MSHFNILFKLTYIQTILNSVHVRTFKLNEGINYNKAVIINVIAINLKFISQKFIEIPIKVAINQ